ncbi:MAG: hypothetical protein AAF658_00830 [Myxococcota bacterium]
MNQAPIQGGWEFIWAAYIFTWLVVGGYAAYLFTRPHGDVPSEPESDQ